MSTAMLRTSRRAGLQPPSRSSPAVRRRRLLPALGVACCLAALAAGPAAAAPPTRSVLILASESMEMPGSSAMVRETVAAVRAASTGPVNFYTESLERSRFPGDDQRLLTLFRQRYATERPALIVAICLPAVEFVLRYRSEVFPGVPLVYAYVDERMAQSLGAPASTTGVAMTLDLLGFTETALRLHPGTRRLFVVGGTSEFDRGWQASFRPIAPQLEGRVAIRYLTEGTVSELLGELATAPDDSLILFLSVSRDREGSVFVPRDVFDMVRRVSRVPVYGPSMTYLGHGVVGGTLMDVEAHGQAVGRMAVRLLAGEPLSAVKPEVTPGRLVFDSRELERFGVRESVLPDRAEILYRQGDWSIHRGWLVTILALLVGQTALILALVAQRKKRTALQQSLDARLGFGTLLSDVSTALNAVPLRGLEGTIRSVLERIRQHFDVDAVAVLEASDSPVVSRVQAGAAAGDAAMAAVSSLAETPFGSLKLASFQPLVLRSLDDLPAEASIERGLLEKVGIQALAMVAMEVGGTVLGVLCCVSRSKTTAWPAEQQQQLRTLAEVLTSGLQRQETAATVSESDRLRGAILSSMAAHITVLDRHGTIIAVNDAWTAFGRANGVREEQSISPGANYLEVCRRAVADGAPGAQEALEGIQAVCDARSNVFQFRYTCDGPDVDRWFEMKVVPLRRPEGGVVVTHRDTTAEREHEIALRESEERFRLLADALPLGVWLTNLDGRCIYVNRTWTEWTGRPLERELGDGWTERIHVKDVSRAAKALKEAVEARQAFSTEFRLQRPDGRFRWVLNNGRPRYDERGALLGYVGGCIDVTDRLEAQSRMRELSGRLISAQEEERRRVARELHDDLQQRLALLAIELEGMALGRPLSDHEGLAGQARRLWKRTNEISSEVHRISHRLLPLKLETLGLLATVGSYCREVSQEGVRVMFAPDRVPERVPDDVALCVFRIVQESLRNVVKHSGSADAHVSLSGSDGGLRLVVTDRGRGFDVESAATSGGLGLFSMRERLRAIGGELRIDSAVGSGTRVEALVPVATDATAAAPAIAITGERA